MYTDKTLVCRDCGAEFPFTASEQAFFAEKGFTNEPGRCPACRANKRNAGGGRNDRGSAPRQMYSAVCDACGRPTQVPFQPRGDKPVYCRDCFQRQNPRY